MIFMYDLEDNLLMKFKNRKECAKYFNTRVENIHNHLSKVRCEYVKKKRDFKNRRWVKLVEVYDD